MNDERLTKLRINVGAIMKFALCDIPPYINSLNGVLTLTDEEKLTFFNMLEVRLTDLQKKCGEIIESISEFREEVLACDKKQLKLPTLTNPPEEGKKAAEEIAVKGGMTLIKPDIDIITGCKLAGKDTDSAENGSA